MFPTKHSQQKYSYHRLASHSNICYFRWSDGTSGSYEDWGPDEPSESHLEMCAASIVDHNNIMEGNVAIYH